MKIAVASDLHVEFEKGKRLRSHLPKGHPMWGPELEAWRAANVDLIVLAGDVHQGPDAIAYCREVAEWLGVPVVFVAGNHEYYFQPGDFQDVRAALRDAAEETEGRVIFLDRSVAIVGGVRFFGCTLWTDFALHGAQTREAAMHVANSMMSDFSRNTVYYDGRVPFRAQHALAEHQADIAFLREALGEAAGKPAVVITHHAPSPRSVPDRYRGEALSPAFAADLSDLILASQPSLWIHGHMHDSCRYQVGDTVVLCNPRGYVGYELNAEFDASLIVEVPA